MKLDQISVTKKVIENKDCTVGQEGLYLKVLFRGKVAESGARTRRGETRQLGVGNGNHTIQKLNERDDHNRKE
jgi:hypothetical protein